MPSRPFQPIGQTGSLLTPRDVALAVAQKKQLERVGILSQGSAVGSTTEQTEELLELVQLLAKLTGVMDGGDDGGLLEDGSEQSTEWSISPRDFISRSLTRKLSRQLQDTLTVAAGALVPDWCKNLPQRVTALFPYNVRFNFFKACAFGPAR